VIPAIFKLQTTQKQFFIITDIHIYAILKKAGSLLIFSSIYFSASSLIFGKILIYF